MKNIPLIIYLTTCLAILLIVNVNIAQAEYKFPGNKKVLLFAPGYDAPVAPGNDDEKQNVIYDSAYDLFSKAKYFNAEITPNTKNEDASVDLVKTFGDYGTVIIHAHGYFYRGEPGFRTGTTSGNLVDGVIEYDTTYHSKYHLDIKKQRLVSSKNPDYQGTFHYVVLPNFIDEHMIEKDGNSLFFLGYCSSRKNDNMWKKLNEKGVKVAFGWTEDVDRDDNERSFYQDVEQDPEYNGPSDGIMNWMLPNENSGPVFPETAGKAYTDFPIKDFASFEDGVVAHFQMDAEPGWEEFIYYSGDPVVLVTISGSLGNPHSFVWDVKNNKYAILLDNTGVQVTFPTDNENISNWLNSSLNVGQDLYGYHSLCTDSSLLADLSSYCSRQTSNGCYDGILPNEWIPTDSVCLGCTENIFSTSWCKGVNGEDLANEGETRNEFLYFNQMAADNNSETMEQIVSRESITRGKSNYQKNIMNEVDAITSYRTELKENIYDRFYEWGGLERFEDERSQEYTVVTPIGTLASWKISEIYNILKIGFPDLYPNGIFGENIEEVEVDKKQSIAAAFNSNIIAQIFSIEVLKYKSHRPCGVNWINGMWNGTSTTACPIDYEGYEHAQDFTVIATANYSEDAKNQDPRLQSRNTEFENAIKLLYEEYMNNSPAPPEGQLLDYSFALEVRM